MARIRINWTDEENETIVNALEVYMHAKKPFSIAFQELTKFLPGKSASTIETHWKRHLAKLHPEIKNMSGRGGVVTPWTDDDDILVAEKVIAKISEGGSVDDAVEILKNLLPSRNVGGIKARWTNELRKSFAAEYKEARNKGKAARSAKKRQAKSVQLSENFEAPETNVVEETNVGYLALVEEEEIHKVAEELNNDPVVEEEVTKSNWTVELQEINHMSNFLNNVTGVIEERNQLREENLSLRQQNQRLNARLKDQEQDYEMMEAKYREVMLMISKVQELMNEHSSTSEISKDVEELKLKMERNGNLIRIM